ncbi:MAG: hypothetical protein QM831_27890 [Kofleriaceae bacterium]
MKLALVLVAACGNTSHVPVQELPPMSAQATPQPIPPPNPPAANPVLVAALPIAETKAKLVAAHPDQKARIERGVDQVAKLWQPADGDLMAFCVEQFQANPDPLFARMEAMEEQIAGHDLEINRAAKWGNEVEQGPILPVDTLLATVDPYAHYVGDMFESKVAFSVLLNFPLTTLQERISSSYTRRQWAEIRLASDFEARVPSALQQAAIAAEANADAYVAGYNIWMHHVLAQDGKRLFPSGKRLISHWNLRDELKANYADPDGLAKQRTIAKIMDRIVTQTIPPAVIDNPHLDWNPFTNATTPAQEVEADAPPEHAVVPDTRFSHVLDHFKAGRAIDAFSPIAPTYIDRAFEAAEMPEPRVQQMFEQILESPDGPAVAKVIADKLKRPLEPHDLWFPLSRPSTSEAELDALTRKRYPTAAAFAKDIPRILRDLGFTPARAQYLAEHIEVDPSRGAGHAMEAKRRGDKAHLRTRVEAHGMDYKGYNIAVHELGHNIEQTFSLYDVDHTLLRGVPNTAFTEALAFLFQARDRELLGKPAPKGEADRLKVLDDFWQTREIAGSALVEMRVWHWLYANPDATPEKLRDATDQIAREVWNKYYEPLLGGHDTELLGIYSHTIASPLYLFNYVLGHMIAFQVEEHLAGKDKATFGKEFERVARLGRISPDSWMTQATGKPVGPESLLTATDKALAAK